MVESKGKIAEVTNATTKQAVVFIGIYSWVIVRNLGRAINKAVYKLPWLFIVITVVISIIVSFVFIYKARAERDSYNQKLVHVTQQLDSYGCIRKHKIKVIMKRYKHTIVMVFCISCALAVEREV